MHVIVCTVSFYQLLIGNYLPNILAFVCSLSMAQLAVRSLATGDSFDAILAAAKESQTQA